MEVANPIPWLFDVVQHDKGGTGPACPINFDWSMTRRFSGVCPIFLRYLKKKAWVWGACIVVSLLLKLTWRGCRISAGEASYRSKHGLDHYSDHDLSFNLHQDLCLHLLVGRRFFDHYVSKCYIHAAFYVQFFPIYPPFTILVLLWNVYSVA